MDIDVGAWIVNRMLPVMLSGEELAELKGKLSLLENSELAQAIALGIDLETFAQQQKKLVSDYLQGFNFPVACIPQLQGDIHDLESLLTISEHLSLT